MPQQSIISTIFKNEISNNKNKNVSSKNNYNHTSSSSPSSSSLQNNTNNSKSKSTTTTTPNSIKNVEELQNKLFILLNPKTFYTKPRHVCLQNMKQYLCIDLLSIASSSSSFDSIEHDRIHDDNNVTIYNHDVIERILHYESDGSSIQWDIIFRDYEIRNGLNSSISSSVKNRSSSSSTKNSSILQEMMNIMIVSSNSLLQLNPTLSTCLFTSIFRLLIYHPLLFHPNNTNSNGNISKKSHPFKSCIMLLQDCMILCYKSSSINSFIGPRISKELYTVLVKPFLNREEEERDVIMAWNGNTVIRTVNASLWFWNLQFEHVEQLNNIGNSFPIDFIRICLECISHLFHYMTMQNKNKIISSSSSAATSQTSQTQQQRFGSHYPSKNIHHVHDPLEKEDITYFNLHNNKPTDSMSTQVSHEHTNKDCCESHVVFDANKPKGVIGAISTSFQHRPKKSDCNTISNEAVLQLLMEKYLQVYASLNRTNYKREKTRKAPALNTLITLSCNPRKTSTSIQRLLVFICAMNHYQGINIYRTRIWNEYIKCKVQQEEGGDYEYLLRIYTEMVMECKHFDDCLLCSNAIQPLVYRVILVYKLVCCDNNHEKQLHDDALDDPNNATKLVSKEDGMLEIYLLLRAIGCILVHRKEELTSSTSYKNNNSSSSSATTTPASFLSELAIYFPAKKLWLKLLQSHDIFEKERLLECLQELKIINYPSNVKQKNKNADLCSIAITTDYNFSQDPWPFHPTSTLRYTMEEKLKDYHPILHYNPKSIFTKPKSHDHKASVLRLLSSSSSRKQIQKSKERIIMKDWKHYIYQEELILHIFSFLTGEELMNNAMKVCQEWDTLGNHSKLWFDIFQNKFSNISIHILSCNNTTTVTSTSSTTTNTTLSKTVNDYIIKSKALYEFTYQNFMQATILHIQSKKQIHEINPKQIQWKNIYNQRTRKEKCRILMHNDNLFYYVCPYLLCGMDVVAMLTLKAKERHSALHENIHVKDISWLDCNRKKRGRKRTEIEDGVSGKSTNKKTKGGSTTAKANKSINVGTNNTNGTTTTTCKEKTIIRKQPQPRGNSKKKDIKVEMSDTVKTKSNKPKKSNIIVVKEG